MFIQKCAAAWGFQFLQDLSNVAMVLSGMSNMTQMVENIATFESHSPLSEQETALLLEIAEGMKNSVPCTACIDCVQCVQMCPQNINIPEALKDMTEIISRIPSWAEICRQREEAAKKK